MSAGCRGRHHGRHPAGIPDELGCPDCGAASRISKMVGGSREHSKALLSREADTYAEASRGPARDSVLDCDAGSAADPRLVRHHAVRRGGHHHLQQFGSRQAWRRRYARCAGRPIGMDNVHASLDANVGNFYEAFLQGFRSFFAGRRQIRWSSLLTGIRQARSAQLITTDNAPITRARPGWRRPSPIPGWPPP